MQQNFNSNFLNNSTIINNIFKYFYIRHNEWNIINSNFK